MSSSDSTASQIGQVSGQFCAGPTYGRAEIDHIRGTGESWQS